MAALTKAEVQQRQLSNVKTVLFDPRVVDQLGKISRHLNAERLNRIAYTEIRSNPKLLECDPWSLVGGIMKAASLGLEIGNGLGHAYLVPYGKEVTMIPGYRGYIHAALRTGLVKVIQSYPVFQGDQFDYVLGLNPDIRHKPAGNRDPQQLTYVYAFAKMGTETLIDVMGKHEVEMIRQRSKAANNGPWVTDYVEMARKTVIRRLCKYLPMNEDLSELGMLEEKLDAGKPQENWRLIEGYEPSAHEPGRLIEMAQTEAAEQNEERAKTQDDEIREAALKALDRDWKACEARGGDPISITGKVWEDVAALPSQQIMVYADRLRLWKPGK
jgi:recombination protein RecT